MRYLAVLFATLVLAACSTAPVTRRESPAVSPTQVPAPELENASVDSVVQFLLTAAATDFHTHCPPDPVRFRDVRIGHSCDSQWRRAVHVVRPVSASTGRRQG